MMDWLLKLTGMKRPQERPSPPPIDPELQAKIDAAIARFEAWRAEKALPAVFLDTAGPAAPAPNGSRVGGPAWLPEGEEWPVDMAGKPLAFLAQLDLGELAELPDFPAHGVLQFFIGTDDLFGCDFDKPEAGDFRVIWREDTGVAGAVHDNIAPLGDLHEDYSPLDKSLLSTGLVLTGREWLHKPDISMWYLQQDLPGLMEDRAVADAIYDHADAAAQDQPYEAHHMGGHPTFTQSDYRGMEGYQDVDRVLLNLWSQPKDGSAGWHILWGDVGQGQFTIRRADLLARRFDRALYQWDCS